jgi:predicted amidohydrolase YtcJ
MKIFHNAKIYSQGIYKSWMSVSEEGIIIEMGDGVPDLNQYTNSIDLNGRLVLPGMHDAHIHVYSMGRSSSRVSLVNSHSITELKETILEFSKEALDDWIVGYGWHQDNFTEGRYPNKSDLDDIFPNQPVVLFRSCHHIGVVNTKALEILGISSETPNPEGGQIDKDENKVPTGILRETALGMITPFIEDRSDKEKMKQYIIKGLHECLKLGLTSVQTNDPDSVVIYKELAEKGNLPIRVFLTIPANEVLENKELIPRKSFSNLELSRIKLFADGSLGASTAAMIKPYSDDPALLGIPIYSIDGLFNKVKQLAEIGWRPEIHAIGDSAAKMVVDIYEKLNLREQRPLLTHAQILNEKIIKKMSNNGIIANVQPLFVPTDKKIAEKRVGERIKYSYAWKTLIDSGVMVSGGSDAPIESANPLWGIYASMYRRIDPHDEIWRPAETLTFDESLKLFTENAAFASFTEDQLGVLSNGFIADFIVLDKDVTENFENLLTASVVDVYVAGIKKY